MPDAPPTPDPDDQPDAAPTEPRADGSAEPRASRPDGSAEPSEPRPSTRPPLRPVDWDGEFTRTWASRDDNELTTLALERHEMEADRRDLERTREARLEEARARVEAQRLERQRQEEKQRQEHRSEGGQPGGRDGIKQSLFDRLENLGRVFEDDENEAPDGGSSSSPTAD
ncbi:hypothetical protein [Frankia sp. AiPa1]|uniref:hypothetical protein n=1 Tax=Frankia sp. AiPa1 TaxID=573492 RepID=UPI00202AC594|nr:hypothetical protein [Frankia sp. AiPa1]MCL9759610.1 hypothetical protein [Frankia sp. AiPa1]